MYTARRMRSGLGKPGPDFFWATALDRWPDGATVHRAPRRDRAYRPAAAGFAFVKMFGLGQWRAANSLTDDCPARDRRRHARNPDHVFASLDLPGISTLKPRLIGWVVHKTPRSASSASSRSSRAFSMSGSARANRRYRTERASLMATPHSKRAGDPARRGCRQNREPLPERRDRRYRSDSGFPGRYLLRRPATNAQAC
jgi:hypothetical protein